MNNKYKLFLWIFISFHTALCCSSFENAQLDADSASIWHYPYPDLADRLRDQGEGSILIFSYGSLMDRESAQETLSEQSMATRRTAVAFGVRRLFDRDVPIKPRSHWHTPNDPLARGMLNVRVSDSPYDIINGVLVEVAVDDLPSILSREVGYDLYPVVVEEWDSPDSSDYAVAYTFRAPEHSIYTNPKLLPRPGYYELTRNAAKQYGPLFLALWYKTTYFADGHTLIQEWEEDVQSNHPSTQATYGN